MPMSTEPTAPSAPVRWIRTPMELRALADELRGARMLAVDSESDSLHHYPERVCLIQIADAAGRVSLLDPLALGSLEPLSGICADPAVTKVFHGASYDLSSMKRTFGFAFAGVFDTMLAAQFLGLPALGLDALLLRFFDLPAGPSLQKDDWGRRPLTAAQEAYAVEDVRHLIALRDRLLSLLAARGRTGWVAEECDALAAVPRADQAFEPADYLRLKGAKALDRRGLAVLHELFVAREAWARGRGRPPFKVLGGETMVRLAAERPRNRDGLGAIPGCTPKVVERYGEGLLRAIARGLAIPGDALPTFPRPSRPRTSPAVRRRMEALAAWRAAAATRLSLDPGLLLPRRLIERVAEAALPRAEALSAVEGIRRWRIEALGDEIVATLQQATRSGRPSAEAAG